MNNFKDYGFEADFEGEIFKEGTILRNQKVYLATIKNGYEDLLVYFNEDGKCHQGKGYFMEEYNLKPIKKEWYENADNVGKLIVYDYFDDNRIGIFKCLHKDKGWIEVYTLNGCKVDQKTHKVRPATKEEVLALLVKE